MTNRDLFEALEQIDEIHNHLARSETYLGYRPVPVAASGLAGLGAAWWQPRFVPDGDPRAFAYYWLAAAAVCGLIAATGNILHFIRDCDRADRRKTLHVWGQFIPAIITGVLVACAILRVSPESAVLLPGLWTIFFSLGVFSSRPFLPRATGWIALFYLVAGIWLLLHPISLKEGSAWPIAIIFCIGQLASAVMLYCNIERKPEADAQKDW